MNARLTAALAAACTLPLLVACEPERPCLESTTVMVLHSTSDYKGRITTTLVPEAHCTKYGPKPVS